MKKRKRTRLIECALKESFGNYAADFLSIEVLLKIYANTYHGKRLDEITPQEWTEQKQMLRGIIRASETMKRETLDRIRR